MSMALCCSDSSILHFDVRAIVSVKLECQPGLTYSRINLIRHLGLHVAKNCLPSPSPLKLRLRATKVFLLLLTLLLIRFAKIPKALSTRN